MEAIHINMIAAQPTDISMASDGKTDHKHPQSLLPWYHVSQPTQSSATSGPLTHTWPSVAGNIDHNGPSRRSNTESEPFLISGSIIAQSQDNPAARICAGVWEGDLQYKVQGKGRVCISLSSRLLHIIPYTSLGNDMFHHGHGPQPFLIPITTIMPPVLPLSTAQALFHSSIFATSPSHIH